MAMSEELTELKYQEILEYQETVTNAAINSMVTNADPQIGSLFTAVITSLLMGCCAMVFMPGPGHRNQR